MKANGKKTSAESINTRSRTAFSPEAAFFLSPPGRSPGSRIVLPAAPSRLLAWQAVAYLQLSSPLTVAGQRRNLTGLPDYPCILMQGT